MQLTASRTQTRRWTFDEYMRLADLGFFRGQRVELVGGRIIQMAPQRDLHAAALGLAQRAVDKAFGDQFWSRPQLPLRLGKWSGPEPDIAVVPGSPRDYLRAHPASALLIIEISDSTLRYDRGKKAGIYAKYGILDYWIVNLMERHIEVLRAPVEDAGHPFGYRYASVTFARKGETIQPLAEASAIRVDDLLP